MRRHFCLSVCFLFTLTSFSQKVLPEFGQIDIADLQTKACPLEPEAAAMKLFDVTESEVSCDQYNSTVKIQHRLRIKIFKDAGYPYASIKIAYPRKDWGYEINELKAVVYNLDETGKVVTQSLEKKDFLKNKATDYAGTISFTFPQLKPGSVVEYSYTHTENDIFGLTWSVQDEIPVQYAANTIVLPADARIREKYFNRDTINKHTVLMGGAREKYIYYKENVPSFSHERYMTSVRDNLLRMAYVIIPSVSGYRGVLADPYSVWARAGTRLRESHSFLGQIATNIPGTDSLIKAAKKMEPLAARVQYLFQAVKKQAPSDPDQFFLPGDISDAWKKKNGSTADLNLILVNLLRRVGVPCFPLLVSTRAHGSISIDFPNIWQFDKLDVVALDSAKVYILDASNKKQPFAVPPSDVVNKMGLLLNDKIQWLQLVDERPLLKQSTTVEANLNEAGNLSGQIVTVSYDYARMAVLDSLEKKDGVGENEKYSEWKTLNYKIDTPNNDEEPVKEERTFEWNVQKTDGFYFVKPQVFTAMKKNPFTNDTRNTDIDFGANQEITLTLNLIIPPTMVTEFLPKDTVIASPDFAFSYKRSYMQTTTGISLRQTFQTKRSQFRKEDYPTIREFFKKLYGLVSEDIILKKKS